jgi:hypothetical protein
MSVLPLKADIRQREWHVRYCAISGHAGVGAAVRPDGFASARDPELAELE